MLEYSVSLNQNVVVLIAVLYSVVSLACVAGVCWTAWFIWTELVKAQPAWLQLDRGDSPH